MAKLADENKKLMEQVAYLQSYIQSVSLPQSTTSHERRPEKKAPMQEDYVSVKVALQLRVLRLQHEQLQSQVNASIFLIWY